MNRQRFLFAAIAICICVLIEWYFFSRSSKSVKEVQEEKTKQDKAPSSKNVNQGATTNAIAKPKSKLERSREILSRENHRPIEFYGKAVDQYGEPVVGADAIVDVEIHDGYREVNEKHQALTDEQGGFSFKGLKGARMAVGVRKVPGYYNGISADGRQGYMATYSLMSRPEEIYHPDPNNPVIFQMWKLAGPEPMVEQMIDRRILCDGTPVVFDLLTGKQISEGGDIRISLLRTPLQIRRGKDKFDYTLKVEMLGGSLKEHQDVFPYLAPDDSYTESVTYQVSAADPNWSPSLTRSLYIKFRGGKMYARAKVDLLADSERPEGTSFRIYAYINPSGSRNLEWDPQKRISPQRIAQIGLEKAIEEAKGSAAKARLPPLSPEEQEKQELEDLRTNRRSR